MWNNQQEGLRFSESLNYFIATFFFFSLNYILSKTSWESKFKGF